MGSARTETTPPPIRDKGQELLDHRIQKLISAGFSPDVALELANTIKLLDSDVALKALACATSGGHTGRDAEEWALYLIGLRDNQPQKFNLN